MRTSVTSALAAAAIKCGTVGRSSWPCTYCLTRDLVLGLAHVDHAASRVHEHVDARSSGQIRRLVLSAPVTTPLLPADDEAVRVFEGERLLSAPQVRVHL